MWGRQHHLNAAIGDQAAAGHGLPAEASRSVQQGQRQSTVQAGRLFRGPQRLQNNLDHREIMVQVVEIMSLICVRKRCSRTHTCAASRSSGLRAQG